MLASSESNSPAQMQRIQEILAASGGGRVYTETTKGTTIVGQFERYAKRQEADCIGKALYRFLTGACSYSAEMGLVPPDGGFRLAWAEPADLIESLPDQTRHMPARRGVVQRVYADGMTDVEVLQAIDRIADEHHAVCSLSRLDRKVNREISALIQLAESHHFTVLPPGWRVKDLDEVNEPVEASCGGNLAHALERLARRNGLALVVPPGTDPGGQTRLL